MTVDSPQSKNSPSVRGVTWQRRGLSGRGPFASTGFMVSFRVETMWVVDVSNRQAREWPKGCEIVMTCQTCGCKHLGKLPKYLGARAIHWGGDGNCGPVTYARFVRSTPPAD